MLRSRRRVILIVILLVVCLWAGAQYLNRRKTFRMTTPESFAKVEYTQSVYRALTPQEDKLVVRHFSVGEKQSLSFWAESLRNHFTENLGYTMKEEGEFRTDRGVTGHRFVAEAAIGDVPYVYELVVFATRGWFHQHIYTAELLCSKKTFEKHGPAVEQALKQFRPRLGCS
jgi:hypothetical protein